MGGQSIALQDDDVLFLLIWLPLLLFTVIGGRNKVTEFLTLILLLACIANALLCVRYWWYDGRYS